MSKKSSTKFNRTIIIISIVVLAAILGIIKMPADDIAKVIAAIAVVVVPYISLKGRGGDNPGGEDGQP